MIVFVFKKFYNCFGLVKIFDYIILLIILFLLNWNVDLVKFFLIFWELSSCFNFKCFVCLDKYLFLIIFLVCFFILVICFFFFLLMLVWIVLILFLSDFFNWCLILLELFCLEGLCFCFIGFVLGIVIGFFVIGFVFCCFLGVIGFIIGFDLGFFFGSLLNKGGNVLLYFCFDDFFFFLFNFLFIFLNVCLIFLKKLFFFGLLLVDVFWGGFWFCLFLWLFLCIVVMIEMIIDMIKIRILIFI